MVKGEVPVDPVTVADAETKGLVILFATLVGLACCGVATVGNYILMGRLPTAGEWVGACAAPATVFAIGLTALVYFVHRPIVP